MKSKLSTKALISLLSASMAITLIPASLGVSAAVPAEKTAVSSVSADSWEVNSTGPSHTLSRPQRLAFEEACQKYTGGKLEVLSYYAQGIVSGVNYRMICRETAEDGTVSLKKVQIYDPNYVNSSSRTAKARFTSVEDFDLSDYERDYRYRLPDKKVVGGMSVASLDICDLPVEVETVVADVEEKTENTVYYPLAYLGKKDTSDGTDYAVLCCTFDPNDVCMDRYIDVVVFHTNGAASEDVSYVKTSCSIFGERRNFPMQLKNKSTFSDTTIVIGDYVKVNLGASGGNGDYTYTVRFKKKNSNNWHEKTFDSSTESFKFKPAVATTYELTVRVDDGSSFEELYTYVWVNSKLENVSEILTENPKVNEPITVIASSKGGKGQVQYAVYFRKKGTQKWYTAQDYANSCMIELIIPTPGDYEVCVKCKDEKGTIAKKYLGFTVKDDSGNGKLENISEILTENPKVNEPITVIASSKGGKGQVQYAVYYRKKGTQKWYTVQNYAYAFMVDLKIPTPGDYEVCVKCKDEKGTIAKKYLGFTVKDDSGNGKLENISEILTENPKAGDPITVIASSKGGNGQVQYAVYFRKKGTQKWYAVRDYATSCMIELKIPTPGNYEVCVKCKDGKGTIAKKCFEVTVS